MLSGVFLIIKIFSYLFIYLCSFDLREGYCPQDVEHAIVNIDNTYFIFIVPCIVIFYGITNRYHNVQ